jgi:hypothetical protein
VPAVAVHALEDGAVRVEAHDVGTLEGVPGDWRGELKRVEGARAGAKRFER